jgi:hypothetical protein
MTSETVMTFASLALAVVVALGLFHASFLVAYLVDLLTGHGVPPLRFLRTLLVTAACAGAAGYAMRLRRAL